MGIAGDGEGGAGGWVGEDLWCVGVVGGDQVESLVAEDTV